MEINIITAEDLTVFKQELLTEMKKMLGELIEPKTNEILKSKDVCKILKVSPGTLKEMRTQKTIEFIMLGKKKFSYTRKAVDKVLKERAIPLKSLQWLFWGLAQFCLDCNMDIIS